VWRLYGAAASRRLDRHTIETLGVPGEVLMESAGRAVCEAVLAELRSGGRVVVVCGAGNNGGDGFVIARHLQLLGVDVRIALIGDEDRLAADASVNLERARAVEVGFESGRWRVPAAGVIVDALFGTGLSRAVEGAAAAAIRRINAGREAHRDSLRVVAVDLPSGLCADTGQVLGVAVRADVTVTIQAPKPALVLEPGRTHAGRVIVARIGIAEGDADLPADAEVWTRAEVGQRLPERPASGHKGTFGHVLVVAGSEGKTGAAALAAQSALRMGSGLVTIACPAGLNDILEIKCTEAMTAPVPDTSERAFAAAAATPLLELAATRSAIGLGPGIGRSAETMKLIEGLVPKLRKPIVIDADGLFAFAGDPERLAARREPTVLTPHPGEAASLLGSSPAEVNRDRPAAARSLAARSNCIVALKGAGTVIAAPDGRVCLNPTGNPALASGGTGDVLTGLVAALLGQGLGGFEAAAIAAFVHGAAADRLAAAIGASGLMAEDLARAVPEECARLREAAEATPDPGTRLAVSFPER
jgi:NAD(P)H-hydrate epimerase